MARKPRSGRPRDDSQDVELYLRRLFIRVQHGRLRSNPRARNPAELARLLREQKELRSQYNAFTQQGKYLLAAAQSGRDMAARMLIQQGAPVNFRDKRTGATPLHYAAAYRARAVVRALLRAGDCDFLLRDKKGRLASEMAGVYGNDPALARLLRMKERKQADEQGIKLTRRPRPEA